MWACRVRERQAPPPPRGDRETTARNEHNPPECEPPVQERGIDIEKNLKCSKGGKRVVVDWVFKGPTGRHAEHLVEDRVRYDLGKSAATRDLHTCNVVVVFET